MNLINPRTGRPIARRRDPEKLQPPPTWGEDELTRYLDNARHNQWATFVNKRPQIRKLIAIDAEFARVTEGWTNSDREIPAQLFLRCMASFRAAAGHAMAGQVREVFVVSRAQLEDAGLAIHLHRDQLLEEVWLRRNDSPAAEKKQRDACAIHLVIKAVKAANRHAGARFEKLYKEAIDFGAHPNQRAVTANLKMEREPHQITTKAIMQHGDGVQLDYALMFVARCGVVCLETLETAFKAKFTLLGISQAILELRRSL
jgi:hypothetical protein